MKKLLITALAMLTTTAAIAQNPLTEKFDTPFGVPAFSKIKAEHYLPAIKSAMETEKAEIKAIVTNAEAPNFENTILAYDNSGAELNRIYSVFACVTGTDMTDELQSIQKELMPQMTAHNGDIMLNARLFDRIKTVWANREKLDTLQSRLTDKIYKSFARNGANLNDAQKTRLREIDHKLSIAQMTFGNNLRADNGSFTLHLTKKSELAGLPSSIVTAAATEAARRDVKGWVFTLDKPSLIPFLQYSDHRELREKIYKGYLERCNHATQTDNKEVLRSIANLRLERVKLLGFPTYSAFTLDNVMAKTPKAVYSLVDELWEPALALAKSEMAQMQALKGAPKDFESWDWWYWAERLRKAKYDIDEEALRPYFSLPQVRKGIFALTTSLYGLQFRPITQIETYNAENEVYEVLDRTGAHLGVLYLDFHPRAGKRVGAWCTRFRGQSYENGKRVAPVVSIVCNFTPPATPGTPALLNLDEVSTFFHEFGHGIHSLVADVPYKGLSGVERDFVELPSQIMENWAFEPSILATYAHHYKTGEVIPAALVEKISRSALFNQGFATVEHLAAVLLDMQYHTISEPLTTDITAFEKDYLASLGLIPQIAPRYRSTYFQHIFYGGYSSGYYSYMWAEVLDADAYEAFVESGNLLSPEVATRFLNEVLTKGGTADGNTLYHNFRRQAPSKEPLMRKRGLV